MNGKLFYNGFLSVLLSMGLIWLRSSFGKISGGKFVDALGSTLTKFASENPYSWYKDFLLNIGIPNSRILGFLIMWGELLTGLAMTFSAVCLLIKPGNKLAELSLFLGLIGGILLSFNFYFAAGWTSPSTETVNLLILAIEAIAAIVYGSILLKKLCEKK